MASTPYNVRGEDMSTVYDLNAADRHLRVGHMVHRVWGLNWPPQTGEDAAFLATCEDLLATLDEEGDASGWFPDSYPQDAGVKSALLEVVDLFHHLQDRAWWADGRAGHTRYHGEDAGPWDLDRAQEESAPRREGPQHDLLRWPSWVLADLAKTTETLAEKIRDHGAARFMDTGADFQWWFARRDSRADSEELKRLVRHKNATPETWSGILGARPMHLRVCAVFDSITTGYQAPRTGRRTGPAVLRAAQGLSWLTEQVRTHPIQSARGRASMGLAKLFQRLKGPELDEAIAAMEIGYPFDLPKLLNKQGIRRRLPIATVRRLLLSPIRDVREAALRTLGEPSRQATPTQSPSPHAQDPELPPPSLNHDPRDRELREDLIGPGTGRAAR